MESEVLIDVDNILTEVNPEEMLNSILDCYKNVAIAKEEQITLRTKVREMSRIYIAAIESNTKQFEIAVNSSKMERMEMIKAICGILGQKDINEESKQVCNMFLKYLSDNNPMKFVGQTNKISNLPKERIEEND